MSVEGVFPPQFYLRDNYPARQEENEVKSVIRHFPSTSTSELFEVKFKSNHTEILSSQGLVNLENGRAALERFHVGQNTDDSDLVEILSLDTESSESETTDGVSLRRNGVSNRGNNVDISNISDDSISEDGLSHIQTRRRKIIASKSHQSSRRNLRSAAKTPPPAIGFQSDDDASSSESSKRRTAAIPHLRRSTRRARSSTHDTLLDLDESGSEDNVDLLQSDILPMSRKRKRDSSTKPGHVRKPNGPKYRKPQHEPTRRSERSTRHINEMREDMDIDDLYRADSDHVPSAPRAVGARETFASLPANNRFVVRHCQQCETCGKWGGGPAGQLIHCQGCTLSYHKSCLGPRQSRDHLVTKVGEAEFVLQCRRCINLAKRKDFNAPDQASCQVCREAGPACRPFRNRKTALQEEREREENDGQDPLVNVDQALINNPPNVLFRCLNCWRPFHFHHLRPRSDEMLVDDPTDETEIADKRFREYAKDWRCFECDQHSTKVSTLVAWRPVDADAYISGARVQDLNEDEKEYLVKWENQSYFQCVWMSGAWVWGVTSSSMRRAFMRKTDSNNLPTMNTEDAVPEEYLRIDIVFDVRYTSIVGTRAEEIDKARIREVDQALIKFKGLGYEDVVWEKVPGPQDGDRWTDFVTAYDNWVMGRYVHCPKGNALKIRIEKARATDFTALEKKKQPDKLIGGELMKYQLDGLNWLYYRWYIMGNAILADEMGLGKTIQVIGFLATLVQDHNCFPFLIVVPNSTCPNWRREIKQWAPSLRVVTYYGSSHARSLAYRYELFPEGSKDLRCHVVVTSYETASDDSCQRFFKSIPWQALFVDEGQRLKSDRSILYACLAALKVPSRALLTGTPLQNNARELFNLLQFLDDNFDAPALELEYAELTKENVPQLHSLIRPFFLRRTKAQVLTFLPPLAQIILPVSMSALQTKLYQSILSRNPELVKAIFDSGVRATGKNERANLNNILMQLRKCLCHPFVYSKQIEDRSSGAAVSHRNLVEASAKLQLLELMLPKLRRRGHRVLIFSQFLDMLDIVEDFLDGLGLSYLRLDGQVNSLQKQQRIDEFNAPDSSCFAFLLSTRAGGVGINLATADTVILLDPDFNPHQDIQALSRAHRIGQKKKVLVYQLMTRASAEEKIVQVGRRKMALDHVLIEQMDNDDDAGVDMESILRFGAADILEGKTQEIKYDDASIEKLIDRSQIEDTKAGEDNSAESQFSFARVWANDTESLMDSLASDEEVEKAPDPSVWDKILRERERLAAEEAAMRQEALGRGKRMRNTVDYHGQTVDGQQGEPHVEDSDSDTDFHADARSDAGDNDAAAAAAEEEEKQDDDDDNEEKKEGAIAQHQVDVKEVIEPQAPFPLKHQSQRTREAQKQNFRRAQLSWPRYSMQPELAVSQNLMTQVKNCYICSTWHEVGHCPLKLAGPELCNLCGLAHFGFARSCPHIKSETQVREMLQALKQSPESRELIDLARKYLTGVKGTLVQEKKRKAEKFALAGGFKTVVDQENVIGQSQSPMYQSTLQSTAGPRPLVPPNTSQSPLASHASVTNGHSYTNGIGRIPNN